MRHVYTTCDRCQSKIEGHAAAVLQVTKYTPRHENEKTTLFDLCTDCYFKVIEFTSKLPQPYPLT